MSVMDQLPSLGIAGLLFVMWWQERQERTRVVGTSQQTQTQISNLMAVNDHLLDVIRTNTEALTALREELRSQRAIGTDWINRLSRQLELLEQAIEE